MSCISPFVQVFRVLVALMAFWRLELVEEGCVKGGGSGLSTAVPKHLEKVPARSGEAFQRRTLIDV